MPVLYRNGKKYGSSAGNASKIAYSEKDGTVKDLQAKIRELEGIVVSGTLPAGDTQITFEDPDITDEAMLSNVYTSKFGVVVTDVTIEEGSITLVIPEQEEDLTVRAVIK